MEPVKSIPETYLEDPGFESEAAKRRKQYMVDLFVKQAKNYDFHDDVYGLYAHRFWMRQAMKVIDKQVAGKENVQMLDLACGTGFVTFKAAKRYPSIKIDAFDLSPDMLNVTKARKEKFFPDRDIKIWQGDSEVPFGENKYDLITVSFAWRNFANKNLATKNVFNALKPGGLFIIQDLTKPERNPIKGLYLFYMKRILPIFTRILGTEKSADEWLLKSVIMMPKNAEIAEILKTAGLTDVKWKSMSFGIACLVWGYKPKE
jgi:demethylmenaquinone methyltransferase/2-methoxy-6-polyprenyl-1,4-benzoquinol methylase